MEDRSRRSCRSRRDSFGVALVAGAPVRIRPARIFASRGAAQNLAHRLERQPTAAARVLPAVDRKFQLDRRARQMDRADFNVTRARELFGPQQTDAPPVKTREFMRGIAGCCRRSKDSRTNCRSGRPHANGVRFLTKAVHQRRWDCQRAPRPRETDIRAPS